MSPELIALARRLVAADWFKHRPNVAGGSGHRDWPSGILWVWSPGHLPDLTDAATGGVLAAMLPESCEIWRSRKGGGWYVGDGVRPWTNLKATCCEHLAEAAARALLAVLP